MFSRHVYEETVGRVQSQVSMVVGDVIRAMAWPQGSEHLREGRWGFLGVDAPLFNHNSRK